MAKGAPFGNQNAKGHGFGRDPIADSQYQEYADSILEWSLKEDSLYLAQFALDLGFAGCTLYNWRNDSLVFRKALAMAKDRLAIRWRKKLNNPDIKVNEKQALKDIGYHDSLQKADVAEEKLFDSELKREENKKIGADSKDDLILSLMNKTQNLLHVDGSTQEHVLAPEQPVSDSQQAGAENPVQAELGTGSAS